MDDIWNCAYVNRNGFSSTEDGLTMTFSKNLLIIVF